MSHCPRPPEEPQVSGPHPKVRDTALHPSASQARSIKTAHWSEELDEPVAAQRELLYEDYLRELSQLPTLDDQALHFRFNRFCTNFMAGCLFGLDPFAGLQRAGGRADRPPVGRPWWRRMFWARRPPSSEWHRALRLRWLSTAVRVFYLCSVFAALQAAWQLYQSDFARLRLARLREWMSLLGPEQPVPQHLATSGRALDRRPMRELERDLQQRLASIGNSLKIEYGAAADYGMLFQCCFVYLTALTVYLYLLPSIIYQWWLPFDLAIIRDLVDFDGEQVRVRRMCEREVERYIKSSRLFAFSRRRPWLVRAYQTMGFSMDGPQDCESPPLPPPPLDRPLAGGAPLVCDQDTQACHLLVEMLEKGALVPANRSKLWVDHRTRIMFAIHLLTLSYLLVLDLAGIAFGHFTIRALIPHMSLSAASVEAASYCMVFVVGFASGYLGPMLMVGCWDQIGTVHRLIALVDECIVRNQNEFKHYQALRDHVQLAGRQAGRPRSAPDPDWDRGQRAAMQRVANRMNANYLFLLMSFKIFIVQLQAFKRTYQVSLPLMLIMALLMPLFVRLHIPYFSTAAKIDGPLIRWLAFATSLTILAASNLVLFPACYVHGRCSKLYKALWSLMAHISVVRHREAHLYDHYAVTALKKEFAHPESFLGQFVMGSFGFKATYPMWVEFHFWWGLLGLSIFMDSRSNMGSLGSLFQDPLKVYTF